MKSMFTVAAVVLLAGCAHAETPGTATPPGPAQTAIRSTDEARQFIKAHLEADLLGYRVKVDALQLMTPAYEDEYVFVANTTTTRAAGGPGLAWTRVIGSAYMGRKKRIKIWKERPIAPSPSPS